MNDDECDLDTLTAMLDSEQEDEIDDSELGRLASLVEQDSANNSVGATLHDADQPPHCNNASPSQRQTTDGSSCKPSCHSAPSSNVSVGDTSTNISLPVTDTMSVNESDALLLAELRMMQDRIRLIESRLGRSVAASQSVAGSQAGTTCQTEAVTMSQLDAGALPQPLCIETVNKCTAQTSPAVKSQTPTTANTMQSDRSKAALTPASNCRKAVSTPAASASTSSTPASNWSKGASKPATVSSLTAVTSSKKTELHGVSTPQTKSMSQSLSMPTEQKGNSTAKKLPSAVDCTSNKPVTARVLKDIETDIFFTNQDGDQPTKTNLKQKTVDNKQQDSDSDWEPLDGEPNNGLSDAGKQLKRLIKSGSMSHANKRLLNTSDAGSTTTTITTATTTAATTATTTTTATGGGGNVGSAATATVVEKEKASLAYTSSLIGLPQQSTSRQSTNQKSNSQQSTNQVHTSTNKKPAQDTTDVFKEPQSGIRIVDPKISFDRLRVMMEGRRQIRLSVLHQKLRGFDIDGDWVTMAVIVSKTDPKVSAKGTAYSIWRLSDLVDCDRTVSLFLFNKVHTDLWKTLVGSVIGILNASVMQNADKRSADSSDVSITVDAAQKVLLMGRSKDLATCQSVTKAGKPCANFVNLQQGEFCTFHVQSAYKKHSARRAELQSGYSGIAPKNSAAQKVFSGNSSYIYGGQEFSIESVYNKPTKPKKSISLDSLQSVKPAVGNTGITGNTVTTSGNTVGGSNTVKASKKSADNDDTKAFIELLAVPTMGSRVFVKHLELKEKQSGSASSVDTKSTTDDKSTKQQQQQQYISARDFFKQQEREQREKRKLQQQQLASAAAAAAASTPSPVTAAATVSSNTAVSPVLGRGLTDESNGFIDLDDIPAAQPSTSANIAMSKAVARVRSLGGIEKVDPNSVKKKPTDIQKQVSKRLRNESAENVVESDELSRPADKKPRVVRDIELSSVRNVNKPTANSKAVDLSSPQVQKLIRAKSSHSALVDEAELEKQNAYFDVLEKTERMEAKMDSTMEVKCTAYTCRQCKYTAMKKGDRCVSEGHEVKTHSAVKRFFRCKDCKRRTVSLGRIPTESCSQCGGCNYERVSMLNPKKGPKLPSEELLLRGVEEKFLR